VNLPIRFVIIRKEQEWVITVGDKAEGRYETQEEAVEYAVNAAHVLGARGLVVDVLVHDGNKETLVDWTSVPPLPKALSLVIRSRRGPRAP
jgi:uncharacterized Rossmann fold enzyme